MTDGSNDAAILQDLSVLYELSLSVGRSIDLDENCGYFLRTLMARKNLDFGAVWLRDRYVSGAEDGTDLVQVFATPDFRAPERRIPSSHAMVHRAEEEPIFSVSAGGPGYAEIATETGAERGTYAVFRLGHLGLLKLYSSARTAPFSDLELNKLRNVVDKFTVSIAGCLDHARVRAAEQRRRELELQMLHAQKLESLGLLAGGVAHDFNNLLTAILGNAELARMELYSHPAQEHVDNIVGAASRAAELSSQLLAYSGGAPLVSGPLDLNDVVQEMVRLSAVTMSKKARLTCALFDDLPPVEGDAGQLRQVVMNLMTNASESLEGDSGDVELRTGLLSVDAEALAQYELGDEREPGDYVHLDVVDTGCGMDVVTRQRIFDPFFTTKFTGRGLGLAALLGIVRGHGGAIRVRSRLGEGTRVRVLLPVSDGAPRAEAPEAAAPAATRSEGTVLIVDDEDAVRLLLERVVSRMGFQVLTARDGGEAVEVHRENPGCIDLTLLDLTMPVMSGDEAYEVILEIDPSARVVLCSGYSESCAHERFSHRTPDAFLEKPFRIADVQQTIGEVLARRRD